MTRRRSPLTRTRRRLYLTQRTIGDVQSAGRGPGKLLARLLRRQLRRAFYQSLRGL